MLFIRAGDDRAEATSRQCNGNAEIAYLACVQLSHNPSTQVLEG